MKINSVVDHRGLLVVYENLPFVPERVFWIKTIPYEPRGKHAHRLCSQVLIPVEGIFDVEYETTPENSPNHVRLQNGDINYLIVPPMTWVKFWSVGKSGILLVLASEEYDPDEYISDRSEWENEIQSSRT